MTAEFLAHGFIVKRHYQKEQLLFFELFKHWMCCWFSGHYCSVAASSWQYFKDPKMKYLQWVKKKTNFERYDMKANCKKIAKEILLSKTWISLGWTVRHRSQGTVPCFSHPWGSAAGVWGLTDTTEHLTRGQGLIWIDKTGWRCSQTEVKTSHVFRHLGRQKIYSTC